MTPAKCSSLLTYKVRYTFPICENAFNQIRNVCMDIKLGINYNGDQCARKLNSGLDSLQMKEPCQVLSEPMKLYLRSRPFSYLD